jgi:hypothetical protein
VKFDTTPFENGIAIYPQPIALSCGRICRARNSQEQLDAILKCAETVTRYLAVVAISSFSAREDAHMVVPKGLSNFTGNLSFGHFLTAVQGIASLNLLTTANVLISMDGRGRALDNIFTDAYGASSNMRRLTFTITSHRERHDRH